MSAHDNSGEDFTFPQLTSPSSTELKPALKVPLTARSTVVEATTDGGFQAPKPVTVRQPIQRNKVALEKGFSQVDWLKLSRTHPDLAGVGGVGLRKGIEMSEVKLHNKEEDAWMVLSGKVYNITPYLPFHPGGKEILVKVAGRDGTKLFQKYHPWVNAAALMEQCLVGWLMQPAVGPSPLQQQQPATQLADADTQPT